MKEKISKLILLYIPTSQCNFQCHYCFINHTKSWEEEKELFKFSTDHIVTCLTKKRLGGTCLINLTAKGETLLYKDIVSLTHGLLKQGHYVEIITNGIATKKIEELLKADECILRRLFFKISYHYEQLSERNLTARFWNNVDLIKKSPCSFSLEVMPNDKLVSSINFIYKDCIDHVGAVCHATVGRDDSDKEKKLLTQFSKQEYVKTWSELNSPMFDLKMKLFGEKRKEFCYAGKWSLLIDIASGEAAQCYGRPFSQNIFVNPERPIIFFPVGYSCMQPFCFNGHSHVALGMIPSLQAPSYEEIRNRKTDTGEEWLKPCCKEFFSQKLYENNKQYSRIEVLFLSILTPLYLFLSLFHNVTDTKRKIIKQFKVITGKFKNQKK